MTAGLRLYVGRRNCSASSRRASGLADGTTACLDLRADRTGDFFWEEVRIMPPREPLAQRTWARAEPAYPGQTKRCQGPPLPWHGKQAAKRPEMLRQRCEPDERRLRWRAWRLPVSEPCLQKRHGTARGARFPGK